MSNPLHTETDVILGGVCVVLAVAGAITALVLGLAGCTAQTKPAADAGKCVTFTIDAAPASNPGF